MIAILITSSILIVLIAALRPLLRGRIDPRVQYALWLAAALRLLIPVNFADSAYSALALLERAEEQAHLTESISQFAIPAQSYRSAWNQALQEYEQSNGAITNGGTYENLDAYEQVEYRALALMQGSTLAELAARYTKPVWLSGAAVMGLWFLLVNLRLRRRLRWALPVETDCPLPVRVTPELSSPCLCGVVRPVIYITPAALETPDRLRHVLAHELTHYRHRDHWWALVRCLCLCLYWFDPLVWWAAALSRQDCELACDEGAIRRLGEEERLPYGRTLVDMIAAGRTPLLQTATTMAGGKRRVRERIKLIARRPKTVLAAALALVVVLVLAVGCTFTGAPGDGPEPGPTASLEPDALDTLRERLESIPEELRGEVALFPRDTSQTDKSDVLVTYMLDNTDPEWGGRLLTVRQLDQEGFGYWLQGIGAGYTDVFACDGEYYYALSYPSDVQYKDKDASRYADASKAIGDYAKKTVLETDGVEPFSPDQTATPQQAIQAVVDRLMAGPSIELTLAPAGSSRVYAYTTDPSEDYEAHMLITLATDFQWEEAPYSTSVGSDALRVSSADGAVSLFLSEGSYLMLVEQDGETNCYKGQYRYDEDDTLPYDPLRWLFDWIELETLGVTFVPDRGQNHEDIVREWVEGYEGAMTKTSPGNLYACTSMEVIDVQADLPDWLDGEDLEAYAKGLGFSAEDLGKTWFGFSYSIMFVPVDETAFWAGNTWYYEGSNAPEGALTYSRVGVMQLTDKGWTCMGTGTGW